LERPGFVARFVAQIHVYRVKVLGHFGPDNTLIEVVILVVKDRGWNVVTADPLDPID
jgi:hypothetical protein